MSTDLGGAAARPADASGAAPGFAPHRTLRVRAELRRELRRRRTVWTAVLLAVLPLVLVGAFALGDDDRTGAPGFVDLATTGGTNFAIFTLFAVSGFLVTLLVAMFCGDPVASEASWSSLRYLLTAPVPRERLLRSKLVVALASSAVAVVGLVAVALAVGTAFYGTAGLTAPGGTAFSTGGGLARLAGATAYVVLTSLTVAGIAFLLGTITDAPLAAVGGAVVTMVVSTVLDTVDTLGSLREGLPTHFQYAWADLLVEAPAWDDLLRGTLWALLWAVVTVRAAFWWFGRKDVLS